MNHHDLYIKLTDAYSEKSLNAITSKIIEWYKDKQYAKLRRVIESIDKYVDLGEENISKCFSKLVFLYHPDKGHQYRQELEQIFSSGKSNGFDQYTHIFVVQDRIASSENMTITDDEDFDIDYAPEYVMDEDLEGFTYFEGGYPQSDDLKADFSDYDYDNTFFSALKKKFYNTLDIDLPFYYLEDIEEIEASGYDINDLFGLEYCHQVVYLNLSNNRITDIMEVGRLSMIEELYLSDNEIGYIDAVSNLYKLRVLDLANNNVDDLTPVFDLPDLEYINIVGNPVPQDQVEYLKSNGVLIVQ